MVSEVTISSMAFLIRPEDLNDHAAIDTLNREAFESNVEADLVQLLRDRGELSISLVAIVDFAIVGHVAASPVLVDGKAIRVHPLVCAAFNADFDGDQMAVHIPISLESQMEARILMLSSHNILHPANGKPIAIPSQDMVLGCYYLTRPRKGEKGEGKNFGSFSETLLAYENNSAGLHAIVNVRHKDKWYKDTTVGRIIFNSILPEEMEYVDDIITNKKLEVLVNQIFLITGNKKTVKFLTIISSKSNLITNLFMLQVKHDKTLKLQKLLVR